MKSFETFSANPQIQEIIHNSRNVYDGNLEHYWKMVWHAENTNGPFHNAQHSIYVMTAVYDAVLYYLHKDSNFFTKREIRNLLVAAIMHDYNHTCSRVIEPDGDVENIQKAIEGLIFCGDRIDHKHPNDMLIIEHIQATQFPYTKPSEERSFAEKIMQDADLSYNFADEELWGKWQDRLQGIAIEKGLSFEEIMEGQENFLKERVFQTEWAYERFQHQLEERIKEVSIPRTAEKVSE